MDPQLKKNILAEFGFANLPEADQDELVAQISGTVFQAVLVQVIERMTEEEQEAFETKMEKTDGDPMKVLELLRASAPDFEELVQSEVSRLAAESRKLFPPQS